MDAPDAGRRVPDPGFAGDDGERDAGVAAALAAYAAGETGQVPALLALQASRVLVPVVPERSDEADPDAAAKSTDMAAVLLRRPDGRTGLLAFTGTAPLAAWDEGARPVPVTLPDAARAARAEGADALVVDVAGPHRFVVDGDDLEALAAGHRLARVRTDAGDRAVWLDAWGAGGIRPPGE